MKILKLFLSLVNNILDPEPDPDLHQLEKWDPDLHQNVLDPPHCSEVQVPGSNPTYPPLILESSRIIV